ncbi:MAG: GAF domain-containing sensor histidine kinase [bacterium]|uniref:histidine kinase n=1 Tax=Candidatus Methylomirabilis tolerans TaxID=3123416 RepID=A0AAJ1AHX1_9BACT|nr:GAF domain-containing sensor histidine kinase [Candidatus Methylomirabilis sp.]
MNTKPADTPFHAPDTPTVLLEIAQAVSSTLDLKELLKIVAQRTAAACGADVCSIFLWSPLGDRLVPMMSQTASGQQMDALWEEFKRMAGHSREGTLPIIAAIGQRTPIVMDDPATSPLLPARWVEQFRLKALLSVPLIRQDVAIGTLVLHQMTDDKPFTEVQVLLASTIASQVALAIENARLFQTTQERLSECETLLAVSRSVSSTLNLKETLVRVAREAAVAACADSSGAYLLDSEQEVIRPFASYNLPDWVLEPFQETPLSVRTFPLVREALDRMAPVCSSDVPADPRCAHPAIRRLAFQSCLFAPMVVKERLIGGLFLVWWQKSHTFTPDQLRLMDGVARQAAMAIDNASAYHEIEALNVSLEDKIAKRTHELSTINAALEASHRRLQELDRVKSDFLLNVSHELRTPLTAIKGSVDNMLDGITGPLSEAQQRYLMRIQANADRLVRMINDLLDLARIEEGRVQVIPTYFSLSGLTSELLDTLRPVASEEGLALQLADGADPLIVYADRDKVGQVLMNLLGNAIKFTPSGGIVNVELEEEEEEPFAIVRVSDTGDGIPPEELPHIFDKFYQVQLGRQAKAKGTGLGLSIVKSLVELQGGSIRARSQVDHGSTFTFTLPRQPLVQAQETTTFADTEQTR